jgi:YD repeat-containing protein
MSTSYYTQTKNFMSSVSDEVDPRTGLYSVSLSLGSIKGNNGNGPEIPFVISYSPTSETNIGFGIGFTNGMTTYDSQNKRLTLNTGEQYVINETGSSITVKQMKLKTFVMTKSSAGYQVVHKNGTTEILSLVSQNLYLPTKIIGPFGHYLTLAWDGSHGAPRLTKITDMDNEVHCSVEYLANTLFHFLPSGSEKYTVTLVTQNNFLTSLTHSSTDITLQWALTYTTGLINNVSQTLTGMTTPLGLKKSVLYQKEMMKFPVSSGQKALPAVVTYTIEPGMQQPNLVRTYTYSSNNYLGYGGSGAWAKDSDFTYTLPVTYLYESTEKVTDTGSSTSLTTRRVYNHFHLMTLSEEKQGGQNKQTALTYYEEAGKSFENQPAQVQCLKQQIVTWISSNASQYSETTVTEYDVNGNLIKQVDPAGTLTEIEYYPASGEAHPTEDTGCPAEPHGFVRYVKSRKVTPATTGYDAPVQLTYSKFDQLATLDTTRAKYNVVPVKMTRLHDGVRNLIREIAYHAVSTDPLSYGRIKNAVIFLSGAQKKTSEHAFTYAKKGESLIHTRLFTGHDGTSQTTEREHSRFTHKLRSFINTQGIKTALTYDSLGRLVRRLINPDNGYSNELILTYGIKSSGGLASEVTTTYTDNEGNAHRKHFDRMGRVISEWLNDKSQNASTFYQIKEHIYDASNRLEKTRDIDYKNPADAGSKMQVSQNAQFDSWGQNYLKVLSSGQQHHQQFDPVSREKVEKLQVTSGNTLKLGSQNSRYNKLNLVEKIVRTTAGGTQAAFQQLAHDGLGRVREHIDAKNNVTRYTWDAFDRVLTQTLPDGTRVTKTYDPNSTDKLITSISVTPRGGKAILIGTQTFDGLGRLTSSTSGGRNQTYTYTGTCTSPATTRDNLGNLLSYSYISALDDAVAAVKSSSGDIDQRFVYAGGTGKMLEAQEANGRSKTMSWWPTGELDREIFTLPGKSPRSTGYEWTLQGQPLKYTDVSGNVQTLDYDAYGRITTIKDPQVTVNIAYDVAGRVSSQHTVAADGYTLLTTLTWDDFNREVKRQIIPSSGGELCVEQTFTPDDLIATRTVSAAGVVVRKEAFSYDVRNRLTRYECSGNEPAVDAYGQPIRSQTFTLDALSNITQCVTELAGGAIDTATYLFTNTQDPAQLSEVKHSLTAIYPAHIVLEYDKNGRMTRDEAGRLLSYDSLGRLVRIADQSNHPLSTYHYDALNTLVMQSLTEDERQLFYTGTRLVNETSSKSQKITRFIPGCSGSAAVSEDPFVN